MRMMISNSYDEEIIVRGSYSFKYLTPDGNATIFIVEKADGEIERIDYFIGKAGSSVAAWCHGLVEFINFAIEKGISLNDIINKISNITSGTSVRTVSGMTCRSGPEAIFLALMKYRGMINKSRAISYERPRIRQRH